MFCFYCFGKNKNFDSPITFNSSKISCVLFQIRANYAMVGRAKDRNPGSAVQSSKTAQTASNGVATTAGSLATPRRMAPATARGYSSEPRMTRGSRTTPLGCSATPPSAGSRPAAARAKPGVPGELRGVAVLMPRISSAPTQLVSSLGSPGAAVPPARLGGQENHVKQVLTGIAGQGSEKHCDIIFICRYCRQGWKKPGFKKKQKTSQWVFCFFVVFL